MPESTCSKISTVVYAFIIFLELEVDGWAVAYFVISIAFSSGLIYCTGLETYSCFRENEKKQFQFPSVKWLCVTSTIGTIFLLSIVHFYNRNFLVTIELDLVSWLIVGEFVGVYFLMLLFSIYLFCRKEEEPDSHIQHEEARDDDGGNGDVNNRRNDLYELEDTEEEAQRLHSGEPESTETLSKRMDHLHNIITSQTTSL